MEIRVVTKIFKRIFIICIAMFLFFFNSCSRYRTYVITKNGSIKRDWYNHTKYEKKDKKNEWGVVRDYHLFYSPELVGLDTNKLKIYLVIFFKKIKHNPDYPYIDDYKIIMTNDTSGYIERFKGAGLRDAQEECEFNLKKGHIHYRKWSAF